MCQGAHEQADRSAGHSMTCHQTTPSEWHAIDLCILLTCQFPRQTDINTCKVLVPCHSAMFHHPDSLHMTSHEVVNLPTLIQEWEP